MPLLDQDLPARAQQGDENALAALIARMMPAIRKGAAECTAPGLDFDDAVQEGLIGLFHAVRGFDPRCAKNYNYPSAELIRTTCRAGKDLKGVSKFQNVYKLKKITRIFYLLHYFLFVSRLQI